MQGRFLTERSALPYHSVRAAAGEQIPRVAGLGHCRAAARSPVEQRAKTTPATSYGIRPDDRRCCSRCCGSRSRARTTAHSRDASHARRHWRLLAGSARLSCPQPNAILADGIGRATGARGGPGAACRSAATATRSSTRSRRPAPSSFDETMRSEQRWHFRPLTCCARHDHAAIGWARQGTIAP